MNLIYFNFMWVKIFYIDNIIKKIVCAIFYIYIFDFITNKDKDWFVLLIYNFFELVIYDRK